MTWRAAAVALGVAVTGLGACKGQIGDIGASGGPSSGSGPGTAGAAASGTAGGGGGGTAGPLDVGIGTAIRLNNTQYDNTVRDLLGTTLTPSTAFPPDETSLGFDTLGGTLLDQPERQQAYLSASSDLINELFARAATDSTYQRLVACDYTKGAACQKTIFTSFATKAWRRPVVDAELAPYTTLAAAGATPKDGMIAAMRAVLMSANFLYRLEHDPDPSATTNAPHRLTAYELATRLSYFLWASMPDDTLFADAAAGKVLTNAGLQAEVTRMLGDPTHERALVNTFGAEWLDLGAMQAITPDPTLYPQFNEDIRSAMVEETERFVLDYLSNGQAIPKMLSADFTYVNPALAAYYGMPAVTGTGYTRVPVASANRSGGLLTLGAYLSGVSNPNRTSPTKRGLYVLDRLLCSAPPPPPAGVNLSAIDTSNTNQPIRQRLAAHQATGAGCAACHKTMDSIGLGLENFDAVGRYRANDEFGAVDASGQLANGSGTEVNFDGVNQLSAILATDPRLVPCVVQTMLTFSIGRDFSHDTDLRAQLAQAAGSGTATLNGVVDTVVMSDAFRSRRAALASEVMQ
ncbi:MAG TPA: DUF1592 domain-containing protein [Polyangia bacterium]|jgi:hypothetical protein|nr:DUF1592 domain-containing protein [Polyangia bacterium]